ncbi:MULTISPECIES: hypothetical protein [unclassified Staphylococcus]|uniref:hypothetical protein n=1 Tax=unclassified Staphylococcus TaxID=91994 RepID=UPI001AEBF730|nr:MULTISPECIES: hypothetical protein [unclassified Staphylococcus]
MMNEEIEWLCDFLQIHYNDKPTLEQWQTAVSSYVQREIGTVNYSIPDAHEQITIFDYELMEAVAM